MRLRLALLLLAAAGAANANEITLSFETGVVAPSFRGEANTTYVGWDSFDDAGAGDMIINDSTPDVGTDSGSFVTNNGEDHISGSLNYYSGFGAVDETITFDTPGSFPSGFTTVIVQAQTLFGGFGSLLQFGDIAVGSNSYSPVLEVQGTNAAGRGQVFAKYELPEVEASESFILTGFTGAPGNAASFTSIDLITIDVQYSPSGFAPDSAVAIPEPAAAAVSLVGLAVLAVRRRV